MISNLFLFKEQKNAFYFYSTLILLFLFSFQFANAQQVKPHGLAYNAKDFGAKGDGKTDDTKAIQSALDYIIDNGGGTLFFPTGRYRLATMQEKYEVKAHLIIKPNVQPGRNYVMIKLLGESAANTASSYANHSGTDKNEVWNNGSIIFSDIEGEKLTDPTKKPSFILAAGAGTNSYKLNQHLFRIEDLAFQVKAKKGKYPNLSGLNMAYAASLYTDNVFIYASTKSVELTSPTDDGHYSAGLVAPRLWCNPEQDFRNTYVKTAFRYGFIFSEHANGNNLSVWNCDNAFAFAKMDHSSWFGRIHSQNSKNIMAALDVPFADHFVGASFIKVEQVGIEVNTGQIPLSFNYANFVLDPNNLLHGKFSYHIVKSNVGAENSNFKQTGGANLKGEASF